jgi:hypothetical protein
MLTPGLAAFILGPAFLPAQLAGVLFVPVTLLPLADVRGSYCLAKHIYFAMSLIHML